LEDSFPLFATVTSVYEWLPIHFAARYSDDKHMIEYLLQCDPSSTKKLTSDNYTPLHLVCHNKTKGAIEVFDALLQADAEPARMKGGRDGDFPLHLACYGESEHVVASLLAAYPEGAAVASNDGYLAIYLAARYSSAAVLEMVFRANEAALRLTIDGGRENGGSIMHAAAGGVNSANVEFLHSVDPSLVTARNKNGNTPFLFAASCLSSFDVLRAVYACDPSAVGVVDDEGCLAFHHLLHLKPHFMLRRADGVLISAFEPLSDEAAQLRFLLKVYPQGASHVNNKGETPYSLCGHQRVSAYARRLVLMAAPSLDPAELHRVNYEARRQVLFLVFAAVSSHSTPTPSHRSNLLRRIHKLRGGPGLVRKIATFL